MQFFAIFFYLKFALPCFLKQGRITPRNQSSMQKGDDNKAFKL